MDLHGKSQSCHECRKVYKAQAHASQGNEITSIIPLGPIEGIANNGKPMAVKLKAKLMSTSGEGR